jgi:hypothetical protein
MRLQSMSDGECGQPSGLCSDKNNQILLCL